MSFYSMLVNAVIQGGVFFLSNAATRAVTLSALWYGGTIFLNMMLAQFPVWFSGSGLSAGTSAFTPQIWFFVDAFNLQAGISLVLSAYVARFLLRTALKFVPVVAR